ncbi:MAG: hypothetical protein SGILL_003403 [Bacillariaceae sp.]
MSDETKIFEPNPQDVLGGRGAGARKHPANVAYNKRLHEHYREYVDAKKGSKKDVVKKVIAFVEDNGGRFLDKHNESDDFWIVMSKERVVAKVSQGIRDLRVVGEGTVAKKRSVPKPRARPGNSIAGKGNGILSRKFPDNGTLPGQPRRLSFSERVKLLQQEQMRAMNGHSDNGSSDDGEEADEEESEDEGSEDEDDEAKEPANDAVEKPLEATAVVEPIESVTGRQDGAPDDVSETETEDSFPTHRKGIQKTESKGNDSDDNM